MKDLKEIIRWLDMVFIAYIVMFGLHLTDNLPVLFDVVMLLTVIMFYGLRLAFFISKKLGW
jgi:hypothetical protein